MSMEKTEALLQAHLYLDTYGGVASITLLTQLATINIFKSLSGLLCILMSCQDGWYSWCSSVYLKCNSDCFQKTWVRIFLPPYRDFEVA